MSWRSHGHDNESMIEALHRNTIITSNRVKDAMLRVDRGVFVAGNESGGAAGRSAYQDSPQRLGHAATISAPHMHAYYLELLASHLVEGAKSLDVGSGSGYLTTVMAMMTQREAIGVEHVPELVTRSRANITRWAANLTWNKPTTVDVHVPKILERDGFTGYPEGGPYRAIHVGAAAPEIPQTLVEQLDVGGRLVVPVGTESQELLVIDKHRDGRIETKSVMGVIYVPLTSLEKQLRVHR